MTEPDDRWRDLLTPPVISDEVRARLNGPNPPRIKLTDAERTCCGSPA